MRTRRRLFRGTRGGPVSESIYGRIWHQAIAAAIPESLAISPLRPYDLRHAALSLWLASGAPPADIAARAGHSVQVLLATYTHCLPGYGQIATAHIDRALRSSVTGPPLAHKSGYHPATGQSARRPCHNRTRRTQRDPMPPQNHKGSDRDLRRR